MVWKGELRFLFFLLFVVGKRYLTFFYFILSNIYNSSQRNRLTAPPPFPRKNKNIVSIRGAQPSNLTFNTHGSLASKKKRRKSKVDKRERGGWNFYNLWWSFFFFFFLLSFRGRGRNKTPAITNTRYLVFIPFLQLQRPPSAFRPAAPITFFVTLLSLLSLRFSSWFAFHALVPFFSSSGRISTQEAPPPILQRIPFSQIIPKTR